MSVDIALVSFGLLVFAAHLFSSIYHRKKIPDVLLLILIGLVVGPVFHLVDVGSWGGGGPVFVAITLVVILFEGGPSLSLKVMKSAWKSTMSLTLFCFFLSMIITAAVGMLFQMDALSALT
ncbi:MAG: cation:proton antiporter, partial [Bacteroidales bacterium]|nr:cation:proton antiporter [Bacteroidales bacterium]